MSFDRKPKECPNCKELMNYVMCDPSHPPLMMQCNKCEVMYKSFNGIDIEFVGHTKTESVTLGDKAIIIGAGPALEKYKHLELLANSNFKGKLFISDVALKRCLEIGITPDKFPEYYVVSVEFGTYIRNFYTSDLKQEITQKYASKIKCLLFVEENDFTVLLRELGFQVQVIPDNEYSRTFANVGITGWWLAREMFSCKDIALIGFNMSWDDKYVSQFPEYFKPLFFKEGYNEELKNKYTLDPLYEYFQETFLEWLEKYPDITTNCTQEGSLHGKGVKNMEFNKWLEKI